MDFTLSEDQLSIRGLAAEVFTDRARTERVKAVEATGDRFDRELWAELAATGLLGIALPEASGGAGLGLVELCLVLEQQGAQVAPVPLWPTLTAALTLAEYGADAHRDLITSVAAGSTVLTVALEEFGPQEVTSSSTLAVDGPAGWHITGVKAAVPYGHVADRIVLSAQTTAGAALFLLDPAAAGVLVERVDTTSHELAATLTLTAAPAELIGPAGGTAPAWLLDRAQVAVAAVQLGVADSATKQAARYVSEREQFGRPLGTFQAVAHQLADCYLDVQAMRVTLWQAAWLLDAGDEPGTAVLVAKWWATDGGGRVVHRVQHLHGGIGVDVDYPIHRFLLWGKQIAGMFGGPSSDLARLGQLVEAVAR